MKFEYGGITLKDCESKKCIHFRLWFDDGTVKTYDCFDTENASTLYRAFFDFYGKNLSRMEVF